MTANSNQKLSSIIGRSFPSPGNSGNTPRRRWSAVAVRRATRDGDRRRTHRNERNCRRCPDGRIWIVVRLSLVHAVSSLSIDRMNFQSAIAERRRVEASATANSRTMRNFCLRSARDALRPRLSEGRLVSLSLCMMSFPL